MSILVFLYVLSVYTTNFIVGFSRISLVLSLLLVIAAALEIRRKGQQYPCYFLLPWLFLIFNILSIVWAQNRAEAIDGVGQTVTPLFGAMGVWLGRRCGVSWKVVAWASLIGAIILIESSFHQIQDMGAGGRASGFTGNANALAMTLCLAAITIWASPEKLPHWMLILAGAFLAYAVYYTGSRKTLVVLSIAICLVTMRQTKPASRWFCIVFTVLLTIAIFCVAGPKIWKSAGSINTVVRMERLLGGGTGEEETIRFEMMAEAIQIWIKSPLIGHGAAQFNVISGYGSYSHCNYTELLANLGIIGFVLYYAFHGLLFYRAFGEWRCHRSYSQLSAIVLLILLLVLDVGMVTYYITKVNWLILGLVASLVTVNDSAIDWV